MPTRTFISQHKSKAVGFKATKDWVSLLLCANTEGDFMVKPMMLCHSLNPRTLKNKNKQVLPVYWRANRKAWVKSELLMDWFHTCFVPQVERYLAGKNLLFKVLLLLDNAPGHPMDLNETSSSIIFIILQTTCTSLLL